MKNEYGGIDFSGVMFEVLCLVVDSLNLIYGVAEEDFEIIVNGCSSSLNYEGDQDEVYEIVDELNNL